MVAGPVSRLSSVPPQKLQLLLLTCGVSLIGFGSGAAGVAGVAGWLALLQGFPVVEGAPVQVTTGPVGVFPSHTLVKYVPAVSRSYVHTSDPVITKFPDAVLLNIADCAVLVGDAARAVPPATRNSRAATPARITETLFIFM